MGIELTQEELGIIDITLFERVSAMFDDSQKYRKIGNKEAADDCWAEMKKANELREKLKKRD